MTNNAPSPVPAPEQRQFHILCAEDNEISKLIMLRALKNVGEIVMASSVESALQLLSQRTFELVITDFRKPEEDSIELIHRIRRTWKAGELPILVISSSMDHDLRQDCLLAGANDCAEKSIDSAQLFALVARLVDTHYRQPPDPALIRYTQVRWEQEGQIRMYCPELDLTVVETTSELAQKALENAILSKCANGAMPASIGKPVVSRLTIVIDISSTV